jgi:simple sugar transport system ATP-binding protein
VRKHTKGAVLLDNVNITSLPLKQRVSAGLAYIPEERMRDGAIREFSVQENVFLHDHASPQFTHGIFLDFRRMRAFATELVQKFNVKTPGLDTPIKNLSGGNIQKLIMARELSRQPKVLVASQPTRGVDIGATEYIHQRLLQQREEGTAILLISEDLDEIRVLSDRIAVLYEGRIMGIVERNQATVEQIGLMMAGIPMAEAIQRSA